MASDTSFTFQDIDAELASIVPVHVTERQRRAIDEAIRGPLAAMRNALEMAEAALDGPDPESAIAYAYLAMHAGNEGVRAAASAAVGHPS